MFSAVKCVRLARNGLKVAFFSSAAAPKVAVVLSGCGVYDGTEVHEVAAVLAAITRNGGEPVMYAPDKAHAHIINHTSGETMEQERNVLVESSRIARCPVTPLSELNAASADALVFPGGFGAAKNLSNFGIKADDAEMEVDADVERIIKDFHSEGKPQALCCISPILAAKVLGSNGVKLTLGNTGDCWPYQGAIDAAKSFGANVENKNVDEISLDEENKIVSTPAFMYQGQFHQIQDGVTSMINTLFSKLM